MAMPDLAMTLMTDNPRSRFLVSAREIGCEKPIGFQLAFVVYRTTL